MEQVNFVKKDVVSFIVIVAIFAAILTILHICDVKYNIVDNISEKLYNMFF
jgi:hypothetical protein